MSNPPRCTAFAGERLLVSGATWAVGVAVRKAQDEGHDEPILIFDDQTGRQVDFDLRGGDAEIITRLQNSENEPETTDPPRSPGRPKLGVVAREVTLLPRHWEWLADQPGGASAALRRLVDAARKQPDPRRAVRLAQEASDRFMTAMLGNHPGYEESSRALYACNHARFLDLSEPWPVDLRDYARRLAGPAFQAAPSTNT